MKKHILMLAVAVMMVALYGCATTSTVTGVDSSEINIQDVPVLDKVTPVSISVTAESDDFVGERDLLRDQLISKLKEDGYSISDGTSDASQKVDVRIIHLKRVTGGARFFLGPLAGSAEVNVTVDVFAAGKKGRFRLDTRAIDWSGFAGTTEQTIGKVVDTIAMVLQGRKPE
jgi:hypothetical protein